MSLSFTALLLIAHGIVSDTSCRPVECLKHATIVCAQFRSPSFASTVMPRLPFFLVVQCPLPPSPPHLTTPLVPHEIVFDMTSN